MGNAKIVLMAHTQTYQLETVLLAPHLVQTVSVVIIVLDAIKDITYMDIIVYQMLQSVK